MKHCILILVTCFSTSIIFAQPTNINVGESFGNVAIVINPDNKDNIALVSGGYGWYTMDAGKTWLESNLPLTGVDNGGVMKASDDGVLFYVHSVRGIEPTSIAQIVCQTSHSGGKNWSAPTVIGSTTKISLHPQAFMHTKKNKLSVVWLEFDSFGSADPGCQSNVYYSQTSDGKKWSDPTLLSQFPGDCSGGEASLQSPSIAEDDENKMFVTWEAKNAIVMDRTYDAAKTWLNNDMAGFKQEGANAFTVSGLGKIDRTPLLGTDDSHSIYRNSLYMLYADQRNGPDDTDIFIATSVRRGDSWNPSIRVNKDEKGKHQFMPSMAIDNSTGMIYVIYYDRRGYDDNQTDVYMSYSASGADKFTDVKISDAPFIMPEGFTGSTSIVAFDGLITPTWTRIDDGKSTVVTAVFPQTKFVEKADLPKIINVVKKKLPLNQTRPLQQGPYRSPVRRPGQY